ncbi:hypothetical protein [Lichenihabitans psoromatis]|uniref:hypothetical protein n=1 Tax=Lichenihabitans psoromatis TaxID=2528642 RepID=UPI001FE1A629|nr:hypothetical protein [Lichenihabitans psoromatis]
MKVVETKVFRGVDHVTSPSADEARIIEDLAPGTPVTVLPPYFFEEAEIRERNAAHFAELSDVLFVGGFPHIPNVDAALFIAQEIMRGFGRSDRTYASYWSVTPRRPKCRHSPAIGS